MGAWFDGKSSQKHFVEVELTPQGIILKPQVINRLFGLTPTYTGRREPAPLM
jgi:hypothetical protein